MDFLVWLGAVLSLLGVDVTVRKLVGIVYLSQFARYLPGNVGHHIGRVALLKREGVAVSIAGLSILLETIIMLLFAALLAVFFADGISAVLSQWISMRTLQVIGLGVVLCVGSLVVFASYAGWFRRILAAITVCEPAVVMRKCTVLGLSYLLNFLFLGASAWFIGATMFGLGDGSFFWVIGSLSLAWLVGTVVPGAPAGVGVREVVALTLLADVYGEATAAVLVVHRLTLTVGDLWTFLAGLIVYPRATKTC